jgi:hypothetical protein
MFALVQLDSLSFFLAFLLLFLFLGISIVNIIIFRSVVDDFCLTDHAVNFNLLDIVIIFTVILCTVIFILVCEHFFTVVFACRDVHFRPIAVLITKSLNVVAVYFLAVLFHFVQVTAQCSAHCFFHSHFLGRLLGLWSGPSMLRLVKFGLSFYRVSFIVFITFIRCRVFLFFFASFLTTT